MILPKTDGKYLAISIWYLHKPFGLEALLFVDDFVQISCMAFAVHALDDDDVAFGIIRIVKTKMCVAIYIGLQLRLPV